MSTIGIIYQSSLSAWYSGLNQTALLLAEMCQRCGYSVTMVDKSNDATNKLGDYSFPTEYKSYNACDVKNLDLLLDVDGILSGEDRIRMAKNTIVFMRTFLQFSELDDIAYIETPYRMRNFVNVSQIWCWDLLNPKETIPSIQTLFPCPIRRVPFIWSPTILESYSASKQSTYIKEKKSWTVHVAEKNTNDTSSSIIPLVAIRELVQKQIIDATYQIHNMDHIKENRFLKDNILTNIDFTSLPAQFANKEPYYQWISAPNQMVLSHTRFSYLRPSLLNLIWLGIPLIHNSPILRDLHTCLKETFYKGNEITGISQAVTAFVSNPTKWYDSVQEMRDQLRIRFGLDAKQKEWQDLFGALLSTKKEYVEPEPHVPKINVQPTNSAEIVIAFSDMWDGFNVDRNFITDAIRHEVPEKSVKGIRYTSESNPHLLIFGPYGKEWKTVSSSIPKVYFSAENWAQPEEKEIQLYLTPVREENEKRLRVPTWMMFIDWFSGATEFPTEGEDNPIRIPLHFAVTPHPVPFGIRNEFCGFVVSNPVCKFRNDTFHKVNEYKRVNSGGALYNNIGQQLSLKYAGGGCGDISKYHFFSIHKFTISFENSQAPGYITEKVLHAKMAGCVPLYWGDKDTATDFVPNSFINLSSATDPQTVLDVIKKLEDNPKMCSVIASTPILNEEKTQHALRIMSNMSKRLLDLALKQDPKPSTILQGIEQVYVVNLDKRKDRWEQLVEAEPKLQHRLTRISAVDGQTLKMSPFIYRLFEKNDFKWKKSVMGCDLSHISIWSRILSEPSGNFFLVLEDDVRFVDGWMDKWNEYMNTIPEDADLLYLGGILPPNKQVYPLVSEQVNPYWSRILPNTYFTPVPTPHFHFCTYSYIITRKGAQKLMEYINYSDRKVFTGCDHLLSHPSIGLTKYVTHPLLTYCFQENDPVYVNSQFNDLLRKDTFDSDIWNNKECFTEEELAPFREPAINEQTQDLISNEKKQINVYFLPDKDKDTFETHETGWLQDMMGVTITYKPFDPANRDENGWYIVQRPRSEQWTLIFKEFESRNQPFKVIHISDEFCMDTIMFYEFQMCKAVIRNYHRPDTPKLPHILTIPLGYYRKYKGVQKKFQERDLVWSFHGTDWFNRSTQLQPFTSFVPNSCHLQPDWNHPTGTKEKEYLSLLGNSKFCPILRGNNRETFRLYEALEAGTLPVTTITDINYLYWINEELGIESLYKWYEPTDTFNNTSVNEETRIEVVKRWNEWKNRIHTACVKLV
jgi:GR25 family glycosyltransferase involved in LPS biosynthesis